MIYSISKIGRSQSWRRVQGPKNRPQSARSAQTNQYTQRFSSSRRRDLEEIATSAVSLAMNPQAIGVFRILEEIFSEIQSKFEFQASKKPFEASPTLFFPREVLKDMMMERPATCHQYFQKTIQNIEDLCIELQQIKNLVLGNNLSQPKKSSQPNPLINQEKLQDFKKYAQRLITGDPDLKEPFEQTLNAFIRAISNVIPQEFFKWQKNLGVSGGVANPEIVYEDLSAYQRSLKIIEKNFRDWFLNYEEERIQPIAAENFVARLNGMIKCELGDAPLVEITAVENLELNTIPQFLFQVIFNLVLMLRGLQGENLQPIKIHLKDSGSKLCILVTPVSQDDMNSILSQMNHPFSGWEFYHAYFSPNPVHENLIPNVFLLCRMLSSASGQWIYPDDSRWGFTEKERWHLQIRLSDQISET